MFYTKVLTLLVSKLPMVTYQCITSYDVIIYMKPLFEGFCDSQYFSIFLWISIFNTNTINDFPTTWILATDCYSRELKQRRGRRQWSVQSIKKINLRPFKLYCVYLGTPSICHIWAIFQGSSWILLKGLYPGSKRERTSRHRIFTSSIKRRITSGFTS